MSVAQLQFSEALEAPFVEVLTPNDGPAVVKDGEPSERRLSAVAALERLQRTVDAGNEPALGLKAARHTHFGQVGVLDYLVATSNTVGHAFDVLSRYMGLVTDTLQVRRETADGRVTIYFQRPLDVVRAAWDFTLGGIYWSHRETLFCQVEELECWFPYPAPPTLDEHQATFGDVSLRFSSLMAAYRFPVECLHRPLPRAEPKLHAVLCRHAERSLGHLFQSDTTVQRVLHVIARRTEPYMPSVDQVAAQLAMSPRTLGRKLELEGTTYTDLVTAWRKRQALHYLSQPAPDVSTISSRLGYSHPVGFHRAFKRWTGRTPLTYHRMLRSTV